MQVYDLIMLIVLGMATIFGAIKGFAWQVASLASIIVSYGVAYRFRYDVAEMIQAKPPWNQFLAMLILYVGSSFVIWVGFRLLSGTIDRVRLKEFDRHLGAAFGLAKGLVYCLLITMFATSLLGPNQQAAICQSRSGYYIAQALDNSMGILPKEIHDVVGPYLARLDDKLKSGGVYDGEVRQGATESIWPNASIPGIGSIPSEIQQGIQNTLQNGIRNALPQILPGATGGADPGSILPGNWNSNGSFPSVSPGSFDPNNLFPQASQPSSNVAPQIFPPLEQTGRLPMSNAADTPGYNSGLRPSGTGSSYAPSQQAQQPNYVLPR